MPFQQFQDLLRSALGCAWSAEGADDLGESRLYALSAGGVPE